MADVQPSGLDSETGGLWPSVAYRIISNGTTVTAFDKNGATVYSGTDGGAALTACLPAPASAGATIEFRNDGQVFPWGSVPGLPAGITQKLRICGNGATIQLSASAGPRFLDLARVADFDTFQHIEVTDFVVDATSRADTGTHAIIGTKSGIANSTQRVNFLDIAVRRVRCFGVPTTSSFGVYLQTTQAAGGEGTQNTLKDITLEDVWVDGGLAGFVITGGSNTAITNYNMFYDNLRVIRCKQTQSAGVVVGTVGTAACVEIGQNCPGGYALVRDFYGEYSGDVGIEIDNATRADVEDCVISNTRNAFYTTNFAAPTLPNVQSVAYRRCHAIVTDANVNAASHAFNVQTNNAIALGDYLYDGCTFFQNNNVLSTSQAPMMFYLNGALNARRVTVHSCEMNVESVNWNNAANSEPIRGIHAGNGGTITRVVVQNFYVRVAGSISGAGAVAFRALNVDFGAFTGFFDVDGLDIDYNITGVAGASVTRGVNLAPTSASTIGAVVRRLNLVALGSDTGAVAIRVAATTNLTVSPSIRIEDCDFTAIPTGGSELLIDATQTALGAVITTGNKWKLKPAPVGLTGLATGTGKALGAQSSGVFWPALVQFVQASGSAITAIDYSTNGGTTYTNLVTQVSAALPAGLGPNVGPLLPADLVKVTFTTTQPTVTLVPSNP